MSNKQPCAVSSYENHPIVNYLKDGLIVTLNTDDPAIEGTSISREFKLLKKHLGLTKVQQKEIINNSISAAFTTEEVKNKLRMKL